MSEPTISQLRRTRLMVLLLLAITLGAFGFALASDTKAGSTEKAAAPGTAEPPTAAEGVSPEAHRTLDETTLLLIGSLYILVLAGFVGFEVISGVSPLLHTPLMSVTNAISAISLVGSLVIAGSAKYGDTVSRTLGFVAVTAAMINVVGGFMITDRMLRMFKLKKEARS